MVRSAEQTTLLKSHEVQPGTVSHPGGDVPTQDALHGAGVKVL